MKKEVKDLWVQALRSGKYPQTTGRLHDNKGFCCLGVLCDVAIKNGLPVQVAKSLRPGGLTVFLYDDVVGSLPESVQEWAGVKGENPCIDYAITCTQANDDAELSFAQIADLVEKNYERM